MGSYVSSTFVESNLETGDIILFSGKSLFSKAIEYLSGSPYSHCGIILKDPYYIDPSFKGLYFLESSFDIHPTADDHKIKFGVMLHSFDETLQQARMDSNHVWSRRLLNFKITKQLEETISKLYSNCKNTPYDCNPIDWILAKEAVDDVSIEHFASEHPCIDDQKVSSLWCSALVGYFLVKIGVLDKDTPWSLLSPKVFGSNSKDLVFINGTSYSQEKLIF